MQIARVRSMGVILEFCVTNTLFYHTMTLVIEPVLVPSPLLQLNTMTRQLREGRFIWCLWFQRVRGHHHHSRDTW